MLQQQILLGDEFSRKVKGREVGWPDLIDGVLDGEAAWDEMYDENIDKYESDIASPGAEWHIALIVKERAAYELLWQGQYKSAADAYDAIANDAGQHDKRLVAWYRHWRALAMMCAGDRQDALHEYLTSANVRSELGRPSEKRDAGFKIAKASDVGPQARQLATRYRTKSSKMMRELDQIDDDLKNGPETAKAEEAMRVLGGLLGLESIRPDKKKGKGPDTAWTLSDATEKLTWGFELKTDKTTGDYNKEDIGQCHNHEEEMTKACGDDWELAIVGPMHAVSSKATPSPKLSIIEVDEFRHLATRVRKMFESVEAGDKTDLEQAFQAWLDHHGLNWPQCVESLGSRKALDMQIGA